MSDLVAWVKEQVRKSGHLKELIKTHTGLTPPAFIAVVALAAAGTALTVSAVSSLLAPPPTKSAKTLDKILEEEIMPYTPSNYREVPMIPVPIDAPIVEEANEEEAPANDVEAAIVEEVEAPVQEEIEAPVKEEEEVVEATVTSADGEENISSDYVDQFEDTVDN